MSLGVYGQEAKCWETAVFDKNGNQIGNAINGLLGYTGTSRTIFEQFGLVIKERQFKEYKPKPKRQPPEKEYQNVAFETYDEKGKLIELTSENRMVYKNTKGWYIKTRGHGNVRITDDVTWTIRYETRLVKIRNMTAVRMRTGEEFHEAYRVVVVTPEEWKARDLHSTP